MSAVVGSPTKKPQNPAAERPSRASASAVCAAFLSLASRSALRSSSVGPESRVFSLSSNSVRLALLTEPLLPCYILHDEAPPTEAAALIHWSAWKGHSANFAMTFSEVRATLRRPFLLRTHHQHWAVGMAHNRVRDAAHQGLPHAAQSPAAQHDQVGALLFG